MKISACIPSRGDVDLRPILAQLRRYDEIDDIVVSFSGDVYGRFRAMEAAKHDIIYTQDDDCITELRPLIDGHLPGVIVNAMPPEHLAEYRGRITLIGFGAIFHQSLRLCLDGWEKDPLFLRECDRVFTALNPHQSVVTDVTKLFHAWDGNRLWKQPQHGVARKAIERRIVEKTGIDLGRPLIPHLQPA